MELYNVVFWVRLLSLSIVFSGFISAVVCVSTSFSFRGWVILPCMDVQYICHVLLFIVSWWTFEFFPTSWLLWMLLWTFVYKFCVNVYLQFSWLYTRSRIARSESNFLRNCEMFSTVAVFTVPTAFMRVSFSLNSCQYVLLL